ncbi:MAG TPA: MFS transporter [Candidatus Saccharimonadales bacterium]|nr:MFS transporter [Candidatus Saccharimonadales bacterium]
MNNKETRYTLSHYLAGALPARLGDEMSGQAILLVGIAAGSAALGSTLLASLTFAAAVGGPLLGALLDRSKHPGRILGLAISFYALGLTLIALSIGHIPTWLSWILAFATGVFMPAISGGWSSRLKSFIADEHMTRASAIDATTFNIAGLAGPALAGVIAAWFGAGWAIAVLIGLLVAALPMAWLLPKHSGRSTIHVTSFLQDVVAGFKVIIARRALLRITLTSVISYLGIGMLWVACPLIGREVFGNVGYGGVLMSVLSASALAATIAYAKWPTRYSPDTIALLTTVVLAVAMLILAFADSRLIVFFAMLVAGLADGPQLAAIFAVRHREAPSYSRSQVFTTGASLKITAAAAGALLAGYLVAESLQVTILVICLVQLMAATSFMVLGRHLEFSFWR